MSLEFTVDAREFTATLRKYAEVSGKDEKDVIADRAGKLAFEFFKHFKKLAPTVAQLQKLPAQLNYRVWRKFRGDTVGQEIGRRIRARFSAASGWLPAIRRFTNKGVVLRQKRPKGGFIINASEPSVTIINEMKEALEAAEKHPSVMQTPLDAQQRDMEKYIRRKLDQRARQFSHR